MHAYQCKSKPLDTRYAKFADLYCMYGCKEAKLHCDT